MHQQVLAKSTASVMLIDGETAEHRCGERRVARELPYECGRECACLHTRCGKRGVARAEARRFMRDGDERDRNGAPRILTRLIAEVAIERRLARRERGTIVPRSEWLDEIDIPEPGGPRHSR